MVDWKGLGEMIISLAEQGQKMQQEQAEQAVKDAPPQSQDSMWRDEHERYLRAQATLNLVQRAVEEMYGHPGIVPSDRERTMALHPGALDIAAEMARLEESGE